MSLLTSQSISKASDWVMLGNNLGLLASNLANSESNREHTEKLEKSLDLPDCGLD